MTVGKSLQEGGKTTGAEKTFDDRHTAMGTGNAVPFGWIYPYGFICSVSTGSKCMD